MITKETIDRIFDAARIEEVVGDFVQLKKRGINFIGLCPFHNEKTPSFNVNPVRNIYKCFGCGKGGSAVNFIMEHEHSTYPEALKYLAGKYAIEVEESAPDPLMEELKDERESLYVLNSFAQRTFSENLFEHEEGRSVGLSYFHERGFGDEIIHKFQLGYSLTDWSAFSELAKKNEYKTEYLLKTGLCIPRKNDAGEPDLNRLIDRFRGRIIFPVHNLTGKIIAFGGRILKKDDKAAKYINSPESDIYHKSQSLYGIFFAKKAIVQKDNCYLAEGYTDVLSLHQSGLENAVASSGTSLTVEQIRLIGRYTKNVTVLYDGDAAGIKASLRGIDLILEEGLNVKVVLFPDGDDPDSYRRKHGAFALAEFIESSSKDFIVFKTGLLLQDVQNDPVRKAGLIREVVESVAKIPDPIKRSVYLKQCGAMMAISEEILIAELNKVRRQQLKKDIPHSDVTELLPDLIIPHHQREDFFHTEFQEKDIIRLLLNYGSHELTFEDVIENPNEPDGKTHTEYKLKVCNYLVNEIIGDEIDFENTVYKEILSEFGRMVLEQEEINLQYFLNSRDPKVSSVSVELLASPYLLSDNWEEMHKIVVPKEEENLKDAVEKSVYHLKNRKILHKLEVSQKKIQAAHLNGEDYIYLLEEHQRLEYIKMEISKVLGIDILR